MHCHLHMNTAACEHTLLRVDRTHLPALQCVFAVRWWATTSLDHTNVHSGLRIKTMELHNPDNPISLSLDCRTDQADLVWQKQ